MKPKEFDELVRDKFDRGDFAYDSRSWDKLAEQMDGRNKKRGLYMWFGLPLAGLAASVALAMGVSFVMKQDMSTARDTNTQVATVATSPTQAASQVPQPAQTAIVPKTEAHNEIAAAPANKQSCYTNKTNNRQVKAQVNTTATTEDEANDGFAIKLRNDAPLLKLAVTDLFHSTKAKLTPVVNAEKKEDKKKAIALNDWYSPYPEEPANRVSPGISLLLSGGVNYGRQGSGYVAGATIRKMVSDKVYVESDVAFASSSSVQRNKVWDASTTTTTSGNASMVFGAAAKTSGRPVDTIASRIPEPASPNGGIMREENIAYSLNYIQVTPSLGYKVMKKLSIGAGADFQKVLQDNRPQLSTVDPENMQVAPMFDIGLIGKTELAIAKRVKAAVYYRKGINNVITPTNRYIDRDYLQFQLKCTIFDK